MTEDKQWRIKKNVDLQKDVHTGTFIKLQSLRWMGHLERMDDASNTKKKYQANIYQKRPKSSLMEYITMCLDSTNKVEQQYGRHN